MFVYPEKYDVIVVGAGPAGSSAAKAAADNGVNILLIERELEIGIPDKCGEFLPSLEEMKMLSPNVPDLESIWNIPKRCIVNETKYVNFVFPNGVDFPVEGEIENIGNGGYEAVERCPTAAGRGARP